MKFFSVILILILSGCAAPKFDSNKPLDANMGLAVINFHLSGYTSSANFIPARDGSVMHMDLYSYVVKGSNKLYVRPLKAGKYNFNQVFYQQGGDLLDPSVECLGYFEIKPNTLNYIGDIYLHVGDHSEYVVVSSHPYTLMVKDNMQQTIKLAQQLYPKLKSEYKAQKTLIGPNTCHQSSSSIAL